MSELVPGDAAARIVGVQRSADRHWGRSMSAIQRIVVLHSAECVATTPNLHACRFTMALGLGIEWPRAVREAWKGHHDMPVPLIISEHGNLVPDTLVDDLRG
jgi:hypothetical protein